MNLWTLWFDGACAPVNPGGFMCWGWVIDAGREHLSGAGGLPPQNTNTTNVAEWFGLGYGLVAVGNAVEKFGVPDSLCIRSDSQLVVNQFNGTWNCKSATMAMLCDRAQARARLLGFRFYAEHLPRDGNAEADALAADVYEQMTGELTPDMRQQWKRKVGAT